MNKQVYLLLAVVVVMAGAAVAVFMARQPAEKVTMQDTIAPEEDREIIKVQSSPVASATTASSSGTQSESVQSFDVTASNFSFSVKEMKVKKGDTVRVNFVNKIGIHDFAIEEFDVQTAQLTAGESEMVEFTPTKAGTYEYYCSVGNHRQMGMVGKLIVE